MTWCRTWISPQHSSTLRAWKCRPTCRDAALKPLFLGNTPADWRTSHYYHYYEYPGYHCVERHYGVRTATHKLIYFYNRDEWELFDLKTDPGELNSVYGQEAYAGVEAELKAELAALRTQYAVPEDARPTGPCIPDERGAPHANRMTQHLRTAMPRLRHILAVLVMASAPAACAIAQVPHPSDIILLYSG